MRSLSGVPCAGHVSFARSAAAVSGYEGECLVLSGVSLEIPALRMFVGRMYRRAPGTQRFPGLVHFGLPAVGPCGLLVAASVCYMARMLSITEEYVRSIFLAAAGFRADLNVAAIFSEFEAAAAFLSVMSPAT